MNKKTTIKGFKAFDKGLICKGFQFEVGKEYTHKGDIKLCDKGFHFCLNPLDILNYYNLCDCEFAEIEANEVSNEKENDSKRVAKKIKIGTKLDLPAFIKASFNFLWENCNKKDISSGDYSKLASSGNHSHLASSGDDSQLASSGDYSKIDLQGEKSVGANIGIDGMIKAKKGCWITLAEYDKKNEIRYVKSVKVDGKKIKEDVFYKLENNKFVEVK